MSREAFDRTLAEIQADVVRMGGMAHDMVERAVQMALNEDKDHSEDIAKMESELDISERTCTEKIIFAAIRETPVARDLLFLTSTLGIIGEIEKAGDDAWKLARRSQKLNVPFPDELKELLSDTDHKARANFRAAITLYTNYSNQAAEDVIESDKVVDVAYKGARKILLDKMAVDPDHMRQHFRITEIFHALEHVSDHATNIAKTLKLFYEKNSEPLR